MPVKVRRTRTVLQKFLLSLYIPLYAKNLSSLTSSLSATTPSTPRANTIDEVNGVQRLLEKGDLATPFALHYKEQGALSS